MSASIVSRNLGRYLCQQFLRKSATSQRQVCFRLRPLTSAFQVVKPRMYSDVKDGDKERQEMSYERWADNPNAEADAEDEELEHERVVQDRILEASLNYVLEYGWTKKALEAGAKSEGLSPIAEGMFVRGGAEIVHYFYRKCNRDLFTYLQEEEARHNAEGLKKPKTVPYIKHAIETRLKMIAPYQSIWKQALAIQALPQNAPEAWLNLMNLSDDIWYYTGDRSVDFDWYTKRFTLAAVYKASEIFMLQDKSPQFESTSAFLDSRMNEIKYMGQTKKNLEPLKEGIIELLNMSRNMIGMSSRKR